MKKTVFFLGCALLLVMYSGCSKEEHDLFSTVYGTVSDHETGDPISAATVVISPSGKTTVSGDDGRYEFQDLEAMQYTITVQKAGYQTNRKTVTAIAGESVKADIPLTKSN
jgi:hypothetical protein